MYVFDVPTVCRVPVHRCSVIISSHPVPPYREGFQRDVKGTVNLLGVMQILSLRETTKVFLLIVIKLSNIMYLLLADT